MKVVKRILLITFVLLIVIGCIVTFMGYRQYQNVIAQTSIEQRIEMIKNDDSYVAYDEIHPVLFEATVAIEDRRFYEHNGFDIVATTRAFISNLASKSIVGGGSTITQQLAKNMYFDYEPSFIRKISELFIVKQLEDTYTKEEILTFYVNIINYGDNHMGIQQASLGYFDTAPKDLTLDQATILAGLPQSPSNFQLSNHYEQAKVRQEQVLQAMVKEEFINDKQMQEVLNLP